MMEYEVAQKYSRALFELAEAEEQSVQYAEKLKEFKNILVEQEELARIFYHPGLAPVIKKNILRKTVSSYLPENLLNFLNLLFDKRREFFLDAIIDSYQQLLDKKQRVLGVEAITAVNLKEEQKQKLEEKLNRLLDYEIRLKTRVDEDILGGMILKIEGNIMDGSIRSKLQALQKKIGQIPVSKLGV